MIRILFLWCCFLAISLRLQGQMPLYVGRDYQEALARGSRGSDGRPGPNYWQNKATYTIDVRVEPSTGLVSGQAQVEYLNRSPDTLRRINLKLLQNVHLPQARRIGETDPAFLTTGLRMDRIRLGGRDLRWDNTVVHNSADPTNAWLSLSEPLLPGGKVRLEMNWSYPMQRSAVDHREGMVDSTAFFCAYWFPRIAVYDDLQGWDRIPHQNQTEFYNDMCDFNVSIRVPAGTVVWATGELQNASEVLAKPYLDRLERSYRSDSAVGIVSVADLRRGGITRPGRELVWRYKAQGVPDFAFGGSNHFIWEAASVVVDASKGRRVSVQTAYKETSGDYPEVLGIARRSLEYFSQTMPGVPYPYPKMVVFNGYGQMEFPMMCNDIEQGSLDDTHTLTTHEIAHTYFPFLVGVNESAYAWMDEGWAAFFEYKACTQAFQLNNPAKTFPWYYLGGYVQQNSPVFEIPLFTPSHQLLSPAYGTNAYGKAAAAYVALEKLLGEEKFRQCLQEYITQWQDKHPAPWDFFSFFNQCSGEDLNWFWQRWFMEFNTMDLSLLAARRQGDSLLVRVGNPGGKPLPFTLEVTGSDGKRQRFSFSPALWRERQQQELSLPLSGGVPREVALIWEDLVDVQRENDRVQVE